MEFLSAAATARRGRKATACSFPASLSVPFLPADSPAAAALTPDTFFFSRHKTTPTAVQTTRRGDLLLGERAESTRLHAGRFLERSPFSWPFPGRLPRSSIHFFTVPFRTFARTPCCPSHQRIFFFCARPSGSDTPVAVLQRVSIGDAPAAACSQAGYLAERACRPRALPSAAPCSALLCLCSLVTRPSAVLLARKLTPPRHDD